MKNRVLVGMAVAGLFGVACSQAPTASGPVPVLDRAEIADSLKWNLSDVFPSDDAWRAAKDEFVKEMQAVGQYKGKLGSSAKMLKEFLDLGDTLGMKLDCLGCYASFRGDENVGDNDARNMEKDIEQVYVDYSQLCSFVRPEMAAIPAAKYEAFIKAEPSLAKFRMTFDRIIRNQKHTLSFAEEALMSKTAILGSTPSEAYGVFTNAEMPFPTITLSNGSQVEVNQPVFSQLRASANRQDRETAFYAFWGNFKKFEGTIGELMNGNVRKSMFSTKARNYESCLDAALYYNAIPTSVYVSLVDNVNKNLSTFHRYLDIKKRLLGVDTLKYSDLYAPAVADVDLKYSYAQAQDLVLESVKPLGDDYVAVVKRAFDERWIDVMPNKGKRSGAYSNGGVYDAHPYILMNYNGSYDAVSTLIHELGHTMQSYYSNKTQPYGLHDYSIFVAEVASTFNEVLLSNMMLEKITDPQQRLSLLMNMLDGFKGTLFRQTQFAEFEMRMYEMAESGKPVTGAALSELYGEITRKYYGHDQNVCYCDPAINIEWAFIPHFYRGFYVYQYSTSFVASQALAEMVLSGDSAALTNYRNFLAAGDSKYPIDELKDAGVDMTSAEPFDKTIKNMNDIMDKIEELIK